MTNGNTRKTFGWLVENISHNKLKVSMRGSLALQIDEYIEFCIENSFQEVILAANNLRQALSINSAETELEQNFSDFSSMIQKFDLTHIEPGFLQNKVALLKAGKHNTALLFDISFGMLQDVIKFILWKDFNHKNNYERYLVKNMQKRDWLICDAKTARRVKSSGCKLGKVIAMDFTAPESDCYDHFLQLPMQLSDLQLIFNKDRT